MDRMKRNQWVFTAATVLVMVVLLYVFNGPFRGEGSKEVSYSDFLAEVRAGHLAEVQITEKKLIGIVKEEKPGAGKAVAPRMLTATRLPGMDETELLKEMEAQGVKYSGQIQTGLSWLYVLASWALPMLFLAWIFRVGMQRMQQAGGALTFGKTRAKIYDESARTKVTFQDVEGVDEAKAELVEVVDFLKHPKKYQSLGGRIPKGVLLVGPPGTGKTLLAKAVAGEAGVSFFSISGSGFVEMFVGVGAARVRDLFEQAKSKAPCIIFIDELDAIGKSRSGMSPSDAEREQTLNQLMVEIDGFDTSEGVIIMAATNTPEVLDPALLRAGRFDRQVIVNRPDLTGREAILRVHARKVKLAAAVDLNTIAARTPGMVGSDLATVVNEAALLAARRGASAVEMRDFEEAVDRVMLGLEQKTRVMTAEEKERVAYHETGHALVALSVEHADPVHRVSIIPRAVGTLGYTLQLPLHERYLMTKPEIEDRVAVMLGGRAAEEIIYNGVISTAASNDLEQASELVRQEVTRFGMSTQLGPLTWGMTPQARFLRAPFGAEQRNYSEHTAQMIDEEVRHIIDEIYTRAKKILTRRRADLERVAAELIRKETLNRDKLDRLLSKSQLAAAAPRESGQVSS
ncbi:MAG: ATP-dependent zinc metalloprotease FtsH [Acidobacteriia bacterium]|nr:ATP-dependent zinc metalloprotease FtsH [Terriglobia bacterium]